MTGTFRGYHRRDRPLSSYLAQHYTGPALDHVQRLTLKEVADPDAVAERLLAVYRVAPPTLGEPYNAGQTRGWRPDRSGVHPPVVRQHVRYPVDGDIDALDWWPDEPEAELAAVDDGTSFRDPDAPRTPATDVSDHEAQLAMDRWIVAGDRDRQRRRGLHTFAEVLESDLPRVEGGELALSAILRDELERVRPIITAIAEQHERFFSQRLPDLIRDAAARHRDRLRGLAAVEASTGFPSDWDAAEPQLASVRPQTGGSPLPQIDGSASERYLVLPGGGPTRFADASFEQVLQNVRVWADALERHPEAYRDLIEDRISDQLVVALNTALPGANREVYSRGGKTDIFIRADALPRGTAPAKVFIGETKKYSGPKNASTALNQLLNYLEVRHTHALLILISDRKNARRVHRETLAALQDREDHLGPASSPVDGWPVLRFGRDDYVAEVCIALINTPKPAGHPGRATYPAGRPEPE